MTKIELQQANVRIAAENAALRTQVSSLQVQLDALKAKPVATQAVKEHVYADVLEAMDNAKRLTKLMGDRFIFTQTGARVICKARAAH